MRERRTNEPDYGLTPSWGNPTNVISTYGTASPAATRTNAFLYAANGQDLLEVRRPGNELVRAYTYNSRHQVLTEATYPNATNSYTNTWTYDAQGRVATFTSSAGQTRTYTYNAYSGSYGGYLSSISESPVSRSESFTWLNGNIRAHTDARGLTRTYTRDHLNRLTQIDYPAHDGLSASTVQYSYTLASGRGFNGTGTNINLLEVTAEKDRLGKWTYHDRDRLGRLSRKQDPRNNSTWYDYCSCGGLSSVTDGRNKTTYFQYNNAGWKTNVLHPDSTWVKYGYDALGRVTGETNALGARTFTYNNQGLVISISNASGLEQSITYNIHDQPESVTDGNGVTVTQSFDRLGRVLTRSLPGQGTEAFLYSARGLTNYTGPDAKVTQYEYDALGRKTKEITPKNESVVYAYNAAGDLRTLTDGRSKTTTWTYDVEGLVRAKQFQGQNFTNLTYTYDANQRLATRKYWSSSTTGAETAYSYDDAGNLTLINYPTSPDVSYTYNEVNQMSTMTTVGLGTNVFTYTDAGRVASESGLWANDRVSYGYHGSVPGLRTSLTNQQPSGHWVQSYGYDAAARVQSVTSPAGTFTYSYKGPGTLWTNLALPTGGAITNGYDSAGRLTTSRLRNSSGSVLDGHDYLYNSYGQPQRHTLASLYYTTFGYDNNAQLTSALGYTSTDTPIAAEQLGFGYDAGWNLTNRSVNGTATTYSVDDRNQLSSVGATSYGYDANGNLTSETGGAARSFLYDEENRLSQVWSGTSYRSDFTYDGLSRLRVRSDYTWNGSSWVVSAVTRYLYDGMLVVQERDGSNNPLVAYTRGKDLSGGLEGAGGIGGLLARTHGYSGGSWSTHSYYYADRLGNITSLLNASNVKVAAYKYDAYGRNLGTSGSLATANVYRFSSKMIHPNSGLYYYGYRFYDPSLQRWPNRDPLGEDGGINLYAFVDNDPVGTFDPTGLFSKKDHGPLYEGEDCGLKAAHWPWSYWRHFRKHLENVEKEIEASIEKCDAKRYKSRMHQGQDWFSHHPYANRPWPIGHAPETICGKCPDKNTPTTEMKKWTAAFEEKWKEKCGDLPKP